MEGYFFYRALVTVFETDRLSTLLHYLLGYGGPALVLAVTASVSAAGHELYLRRDRDCNLVACFLAADAMVAMTSFAVATAVINGGVTAIAIYVAHRASGRRYTKYFRIRTQKIFRVDINNIFAGT